MALFLLKTVVAAVLISFVSWLSGKKVVLAGFITALPLTTLLALVYSYFEWGSSDRTIEYAKSIFFAIPISLLFFLPFFMTKKFNFGFWPSYFVGIALLGVGYYIHQFIQR